MAAGRRWARPPARPEVAVEGLAAPRRGWVAWVTATDHKRIGVLYLGAALSFLALALVEFVLLKLQLAVPDNTLLRPEIFDRLLSVHGTTFVFLFGLPVAAGLASYLVPLMIGARGVAFPLLGSLSWWLYVAGGASLYASFLYTPPGAGAVPLVPLADDAFLPGHGIDVWIMSAGLVALGSVCFAINLVVTVGRLRAPGMAWRRLPLFAWASTVYAYLLLVLSPVLLAALAMLFVDRHYSGVFFDPGEGGSPLLWQHLIWLYLTGAYFAMLIPACGAISEIVATLSRRPIAGHGALAACLVALGALGPLAWLQNLYPAPMGSAASAAGMVFATLLAVPLAVMLFNWLATIWGGALRPRAPLLFALGAISTLSVGLAAELVLTLVPVGWQLDNTAFAGAATGYTLTGGAVLGSLAALYYWFPKIAGRTLGEGLARASLGACLLGVHLTFAPMLLAGLEGQAVDVQRYFEGSGLGVYNLLSAIGAVVLAAGILLSLANAALGARRGARAGHDPWLGATLEWFTSSPPPENNFDLILDVRSARPLRDIRAEIERRAADGAPAGAPAGAGPVA